MDTITIQEFEKGKEGDHNKMIEQSLHDLILALKDGDSVLLYPS
jgi:hypothetical protein